MNEFIIRIGTFFIVIGIGILILFIASDFANKPDFDYFFLSMLVIGLGWLLRRRKPPPPSSGRFSTFRRMREGRKSHEEKKK